MYALPSRAQMFSAIAVAVFSSSALGAVLFTNPITGTNPNTANPYTTGQTTDPNVTAGGIGRGAGATSSNANDRYSASSWNTAGIDTTAYFSFTLTPNAGYEIDFTNFVYTGQASGTGATAVAFRSSVDSFAADIGTPTTTGTTISLTGAAYQNINSVIEFRIYGWGASAAGGTWSINDFTFNGTAILSGGSPNYLDTNGSTAGIGIAGGGSTVWDTTTNNWTPLADGTGAPKLWDPAQQTYFGGTAGTVNVSTVAPQAGFQFDSTGYVLNGGTITLTTTNIVTVTNGSDSATVNSKLSGTVGLNKAGAGTLVLGSTDNDFAGTITISGGALQVSDNLQLGALGNAIALSGGTLKTTASISNARNYSGTGGLDIAGSTTLTSTGAFGTTGLTLSNTGTLDLQGTTPAVGTLTLTGAGTLTSSTGVSIGITNITASALTGTATISSTGGINMGSGQKVVDVGAAGTLAITAAITLGGTGNQSLRKTGGGTLELSGVNTGLYRVQVGIAGSSSGGIVKINNKNSLGANQVFLNNGTLQATAALTGANALPIGFSVGGYTAGGHGTLAGSDMEFAGDSLIFQITGEESALTVNNTTKLAGSNLTLGGGTATNFKLDGTGKLIVNSNASTMTLATTISGATAEINNAWGSDISVVSGGTLQGTGTISGAVTTSLGTTLAPGNSIGTLTTGALSISGGLDAELGAGVSDLISVGGNLTINPTATINFLGVADNVTSYALITYTGTLTGTFNSPTPPSGYTLDYGTGSNSQVKLLLVPEPTSLSLLALGALTLLRRRR